MFDALFVTALQAAPVQAIAPASITASSGMTGSLSRLRSITPASVSVTSNVSVNIKRLRNITPAAISVTSNVSASIVRNRRMAAAAISASSNVSGSIVFRYPYPYATVIDTFDRSTGLGSDWTVPLFSGLSTLAISGNLLESASTGTAGNGYWSSDLFGPDLECYITIASQPPNGSDHPRIWFRVTNPGSSLSGYRLARSYSAAGTDTVTLTRFDAGALGATLLTISTVDFNAGDKIGIRAVGSTITVLRYDVGTGIMAPIGSVTDSTYVTPGYIGLQASLANASHTQSQLDDFAAITIGPTFFANISSTSNMSGSIIRIRRMTTAAINSTSGLSLAISGIKRVASTLTAASNVVISRLGRTRPLIIASLVGTSTISLGLINRFRLVTISSITASSNVTSGIGRQRANIISIDAIQATSPVVIQGSPPITLVATSNMGLLLRKVRLITAITATASSNVSVSIRRFISPFRVINISTTSVMSPLVFIQIRAIAPSISAHSDVDVTVNAKKAISATINSTSILATNIARNRPITFSSITASSSVSTDIEATRPVVTSNVNATSTVAVSIARQRAIAPIITATSTVTVTTGAVRHITATLTSKSDVVTFIVRVGALTPLLIASSNITAGIRRARGFNPIIVSTSNVVADTKRFRGFSPIINSTSTISLGLVKQHVIFTTASASSSVSVSKIKKLHSFDVSILSTSTISVTGLVYLRTITPTLVSTSDINFDQLAVVAGGVPVRLTLEIFSDQLMIREAV